MNWSPSEYCSEPVHYSKDWSVKEMKDLSLSVPLGSEVVDQRGCLFDSLSADK